jgi:hypothetical protein
MEGMATGLVRKYDGECPHHVRGQLVLTSRFLEPGGERPIPFARAEIISIRPGTVGQFRRDKTQAEKDGYKNGAHWFGNINRMYKGLKDSDEVYHLSFRIIQIDKQAGQRPDVEEL